MSFPVLSARAQLALIGHAPCPEVRPAAAVATGCESRSLNLNSAKGALHHGPVAQTIHDVRKTITYRRICEI